MRLQAHAPELFACGIAKSGAYNRTLTPFGFQAEERTLWQATDVYMQMSPFLNVSARLSPAIISLPVEPLPSPLSAALRPTLWHMPKAEDGWQRAPIGSCETPEWLRDADVEHVGVSIGRVEMTGMHACGQADKVKRPLLLIHGEDDNNTGTFPMQSERFYAALKGHGAATRLVLLPHESHGYSARESVMHVLAETDDWLRQYCEAGRQQQQAEANGAVAPQQQLSKL